MGINEKEKHMMVLDALTDALGRSEDQSAEEIKEDLREEGIDVDSSLDRLKKIQQNISMEAKRSALDTAMEKRLEFEKKRPDIVGKLIGWTREQLLDRFNKLIELSDLDFGMAHRDLESKETEDIKSILEDLELAYYRQKLEKDRDDK